MTRKKTTSVARKRRKPRYGEYVRKVREEERSKELEKIRLYERRIARLRKQLKKMGDVPKSKKQIISTLTYFVKFVGIVTEFRDEGLLDCRISEKAKEFDEFNSSIDTIVRRNPENRLHYVNESKPGEKVTTDNIFFGVAKVIEDENIGKYDLVCESNGKKYKVIVQLHSVSDWMNGRVKNVQGKHSQLEQTNLAEAIAKIKTDLEQTIYNVLKDS